MFSEFNPSIFDISESQFAEIISRNYSIHSHPAFDTDEFRMYSFKITKCSKPRSHDWTECPFAHRGEKARRRDPRKYHYFSIACPDHRAGECKRGELCEFAHGIFEFWLHPSRYRTRLCNFGVFCRRKVCFFAHTIEQLRPAEDVKHRIKHHSIKHHCQVRTNNNIVASLGSSNGSLTGQHDAGEHSGLCNGSEISGGAKKLPVPPNALLTNENYNLREINWDFLEALRRLSIGNGRGMISGSDQVTDLSDFPELPDTDWVSDLVD